MSNITGSYVEHNGLFYSIKEAFFYSLANALRKKAWFTACDECGCCLVYEMQNAQGRDVPMRASSGL